MVHHGLSAGEALHAATGAAARALGLEEFIGTVEPGRLPPTWWWWRAGHPLSEPSVLLDPGRIWLVLQVGEPVAGAAIESGFGL